MRPKYEAGSVKERLIIEGFGGIRHLELDLNRIVLLTGPQAEGKSLCAKLLHFFKSFIAFSFHTHFALNFVHDEIVAKFVEHFPSMAWGDDSFRVTYVCNERKFSLEHNKDSGNICDVKMDDGWYDWLSEVRNNWFSVPSSVTFPLGFLQLFMPAERISIPSFKQNTFRLREKIGIEPFLEEFGRMYEESIEFLDRYSKQVGGPLEGLPDFAYELLNGKMILRDGRAFIEHKDGRNVPLENSSSGQKQTAPLLMILNRVFASQIKVSGYTLYPEEPEANLFPEAQQAMVYLLSYVYHKAFHDIQLIIATHSPYILSTFNNLLEAGIVQRKFPDKLEQITALVPEDCILDPADLTAYSIGPEGAVSLMDPEPPPERLENPEWGRTLLQPLRDREFRPFLFFAGYWYFAAYLAFPFFNLYMMEGLGMDVRTVQLLSAISTLGMAVSARYFGLLFDRYGFRPSLQLLAALKILTPLGFILAVKGAWFTLPLCTVTMFLDGIFLSSMALGLQGPMLKNTPRRNRTMYIASANFFSIGVMACLAPALAGRFITVYNDSPALAQFGVNAYQVVFAASGLLCLSAFFVAGRLHEPSAAPFGVLARQALTLTGLRVPHYVHVLQESSRESVRIAALKKLGALRSPMALSAVIEALGDPSVAVRHRAAETLGKIGTAEACDALTAALFNPASGIQSPAARALGEIGGLSLIHI